VTSNIIPVKRWVYCLSFIVIISFICSDDKGKYDKEKNREKRAVLDAVKEKNSLISCKRKECL